DALGFGLVADGVGVVAGLGLAGLLERLQVEDDGGVFAATADESFVEFGRDGNAVDSGRVRNRADEFPGLGIDDVHLVAMGDEDAVARGIEDQVVPAAGSADFDFVDDLVAFGGERRGG